MFGLSCALLSTYMMTKKAATLNDSHKQTDRQTDIVTDRSIKAHGTSRRLRPLSVIMPSLTPCFYFFSFLPLSTACVYAYRPAVIGSVWISDRCTKVLCDTKTSCNRSGFLCM